MDPSHKAGSGEGDGDADYIPLLKLCRIANTDVKNLRMKPRKARNPMWDVGVGVSGQGDVRSGGEVLAAW